VSATAAPAATAPVVDSGYASFRLGVAVLIMTLGASGMYVIPVVLPAVQAEFGVGGLLMGRLADRFGVVYPLLLGGACIGAGYVLAASTHNFAVFNAAHALLLGFGCSATFSPLLADTSLWFVKRRGIAVAICASGNYLGGAIWPPLVQRATP